MAPVVTISVYRRVRRVIWRITARKCLSVYFIIGATLTGRSSPRRTALGFGGGAMAWARR
jgi:hypothetical protein